MDDSDPATDERRTASGSTETPSVREVAARRGAGRGATRAESEGVAVGNGRREAAVEGAIAAVEPNEDVALEVIEAAAEGAVHGALRRRTDADPEVIRAAVQGAVTGAIAAVRPTLQVKRTVVTAAARGAAEGALAGLRTGE